MKNVCLFFSVFIHVLYLRPLAATQNVASSSVENEVQAVFEYFLNEVELDATLTHEEQYQKIQEFKMVESQLSPKAASCLTSLLIEETRLRIIDMLKNAALDSLEMNQFLASYEKAILDVQNMNVEMRDFLPPILACIGNRPEAGFGDT